jgi:biopolymer transport protein ExbB
MLLLVGLSVASVAVILERTLYFARRRRACPDLLALLREGRLERGAASSTVAASRPGGARGARRRGRRPAAVQEAVACAIAERRLDYERGLSFLGTLGNTRPSSACSARWSDHPAFSTSRWAARRAPARPR